jgi:hypothetical protein
MSKRAIVVGLAAASLLGACSLFTGAEDDPDAAARTNDPYHVDPAYGDNPDYFGDRYKESTDHQNVLSALGFGSNSGQNNGGGVGGGGGAGVGVNSYLWRATLDTLSFMPLASADPFGGVIITDWYSPPEQQAERFKVNIFILGRELRADGVRASVFRQKRDPGGSWVDASVDQATGTDLENAILTRARQMRLSTASK